MKLQSLSTSHLRVMAAQVEMTEVKEVDGGSVSPLVHEFHRALFCYVPKNPTSRHDHEVATLPENPWLHVVLSDAALCTGVIRCLRMYGLRIGAAMSAHSHAAIRRHESSLGNQSHTQPIQHHWLVSRFAFSVQGFLQHGCSR